MRDDYFITSALLLMMAAGFARFPIKQDELIMRALLCVIVIGSEVLGWAMFILSILRNPREDKI